MPWSPSSEVRPTGGRSAGSFGLVSNVHPQLTGDVYKRQILSWSAFWTPFAVFAGTMIALGWFCVQRPETKKLGTLAVLSFVFLVHSYGLVLFLNGEFDRSVPAIHSTVVVRRWTVSGRSTSYHFRVSPWIDDRGARDITVARPVSYTHLDVYKRQGLM